MNLIDKDALIEALGIETDCYDCEHERMKYHCDLDPVEACTKIIEAPVIIVTAESAQKAIEVLKNAAWLGAVYSFEETEEAVKTAIRTLQVTSAQHNVHNFPKDADCISRQQAIDTAVTFVRRTLLDSKPIDVKMSSDYIFVNLVEPMRKLPTAQPETNCSEFPNNSDTISRQAAIDALGEEPPVWYDGEDEIAERNQWRRAVKAIKAVPSAQSYTEAEIQRMQDLEQTEIDKAFELGKEEGRKEAQPEPKEIGYGECANALLKMWMDNVLTDGEYNCIMDKLNKHWGIWERKDD